METLTEIHHKSDNMTAIVFKSPRGFAVSLRDNDSNMIVGSFHGFKTEDAAIAKGKELTK